MAVSAKPIFDIRDPDLKSIIRGNAPYEAIPRNDILAELDRRASRRQALASFGLSATGLGIALVALVVTALKPWA